VSGAALLFANLGAEEGGAWLRASRHPRVRSVARLWATLFPADARLAGPGAPVPARLAPPFAGGAEEAAFPFCAPGRALVPWLATPEAEALARTEGVPLAGPAPDVVARVHDKAFAQAQARALGLVPAELRDAELLLEPDDLRDADAVRCRIEAELARWPDDLAARFVLKPRSGTSGRGRIPGQAGCVDPERLSPAALERLRACGGALVEPWLERTLDLSAQLYVAGASEVRVLGTLRLEVTRSGGPAGNAGRLRADGSVDSGTPWDGELRAAALAVAGAAAGAGFRGACGIDAFVFRAGDGREVLRPVVELNARFTMGTVALGVLERAKRAGLARGGAEFYFGFSHDAGGELLTVLDGDPSARLHLSTRSLP